MSPRVIVAVQELRVGERPSKTEAARLDGGARIVLPTRPGLTAGWLQQIADCHRARIADGSKSSTPGSPLDVRRSDVHVTFLDGAFAVDVTSTDAGTAREILARARALLIRDWSNPNV